jgi:hypothetical protein
MLALSALGAAEPAAARGSVGVYIGGPGYYGGGYDYRDYCRDPRYRYYHRYECDRYYGYDDSYYDDGPYYGGPGFFFFDSFGHRHRRFDHDRHFGGHWGGNGGHNGGHWGGEGGHGRHH